MLTPPTRSVTVARYAPGFGYGAAEWEAVLAGLAWGERGVDEADGAEGAEGSDGVGGAEALKFGDRSSVWRAALTLGAGAAVGGRKIDAVIKVEPLRPLRAWLRSTKAHRQWRGARLLMGAGVATAEPVAVLHGESGGGRVEALVLSALAGRTVLEWLAERAGTPHGPGAGAAVGTAVGGGIAEERRVCGVVARTLWAMSSQGLVNGDFKPSNLILAEGVAGGVGVIDTVAVRRARRGARVDGVVGGLDDPAVRRALVDLYLEPTGCGVGPRRALCARMLRSVARGGVEGAAWGLSWKGAWAAMARMILEHGDPRPRHDPLKKPGAVRGTGPGR